MNTARAILLHHGHGLSLLKTRQSHQVKSDEKKVQLSYILSSSSEQVNPKKNNAHDNRQAWSNCLIFCMAISFLVFRCGAQYSPLALNQKRSCHIVEKTIGPGGNVLSTSNNIRQLELMTQVSFFFQTDIM